jgi:hypothetical protein
MLSLSEDEESVTDFENGIHDQDKEFDTDWINEFEKVDKDYASFYLEDLNYVKVTIIYVNNSNELEKIKEEKIFLQKSNNISREEIIGILKRNNTKDDKTFTIMTMLKYNLDLEPTDVRSFLLNNTNGANESEYLSVVKDVDEIAWNRTISMFQDLNNLFIIFYENEKIKMQQQKSENGNGKTKRIYLSSNASLSSHKKTLKKKLKTT